MRTLVTTLVLAGLGLSASIARADDSRPEKVHVQIVFKRFMIGMRRVNEGGEPGQLREFLDPRYLAAHDLETGPLSIETFDVFSLRQDEVAPDHRTVVCVRERDDGGRDLLLFRVVNRGEELYFTPVTPPDETTGRFTGWMLRMPIEREGDG